MKIAIVYKSVSGNTKLLAEAIGEELKEKVVYIGEPAEGVTADLYFVGSWTDKGMCCQEMADYIKTLENKKMAYFGTAGFGGSEEYYHALFERIKKVCPASSEIVGCFFCQGKMPVSVRNRYAAMLQEHPGDQKLEASIKNFDEALTHPDENDLRNAGEWAVRISGNC